MQRFLWLDVILIGDFQKILMILYIDVKKQVPLMKGLSLYIYWENYIEILKNIKERRAPALHFR